MELSCTRLRQLGKQSRNSNMGTIIGIVLLAYVIGLLLSGTIVGGLLVAGVLELGIAMSCLKLVRKQQLTVNNLFDSLNQFVPALMASILMWIYTLLWSLLLVIPGIIASINYSMTYYILADYPQLTANQAISKSKELMHGYKWKFFCLQLSFIGWIIVGAFTLGILYIWLAPHMLCTNAVFYEYVRSQKGWTCNSVEDVFEDRPQIDKPTDSWGEPI